MLGVLGAPLLLFAIATAAWAIDARAHRDQVARGVEVAGKDMAGSTREQVEAEVTALAGNLPDRPVRIVTQAETLTTTAGDLGVTLDTSRSIDEVMRLGHHDAGPLAPLRWTKALFTGRDAHLVTHLDRAKATATIVRLEGDRRTEPSEPQLNATVAKITVKRGHAGHGLDIAKALDDLPARIVSVRDTIEIRARSTTQEPTLDDAAVSALARRATEISSNPITIEYGDSKTAIDTTKLRPGFHVVDDHGTARLGLDPKLVADLLAQQTTKGANPTGVRFDIVKGVPVPLAGHDAEICCGDAAPGRIVAALLDGATTVKVPTTTITAAQGVEWAKGLGVKEVVGAFTTRHGCCAPRVTNIHRIADIVRGTLIAPGATFSVNDFVGRRTKEKGFVSAPVIEDGQFSEDVGGGVSQFATTTFNAAFFAGLDIPDHKAHSIYISRYPFGREATLAYPSVDLKIKNNTPYGVIIWPTYTSTSLTVQLWSTKFIVGAQTGSNKTSGCGPVTVTRTRTWLSDGHTATDRFRANYNCNPPKHE